MKNLFDLNLTTNETESDRFIVKKLPDELERKRRETEENFAAVQKDIRTPLRILIADCCLCAAAAAIFCSFFGFVSAESFEAAYAKSGWMLYTGGILFLLSLATAAFLFIKIRKTMNSPAMLTLLEDSEKLSDRCYDELGVPSDAETIDVFAEDFSVKRGKLKNDASVYRYSNNHYKIFNDDYNLYLADVKSVYAFPLSCLKKIACVNKKATFFTWNKDAAHNKGYYKQYKIRSNRYGAYTIKPYYSVRLISLGEEYEIIIPGYELQTLSKYVKLNVL